MNISSYSTFWLWIATGSDIINMNGYYPPWKRGDIGLSLSVCLSVRPSVRLSVPLEIGYFVHASWVRALKFYTRINQGLKSCLVKLSSRSVENCRFWSTLKIVDFYHFYRCQALCAGEFGMKQLKPRSQSRASLRFNLDRLKIVDYGTLWKLSVLTFSPDVKYMCTRV